MRIVLIGASGFLGGYLLSALTRDQHECIVLTRTETRHSTIGMFPGVELVQGDVYDVDKLKGLFRGADAVISMAGILNERGRGGMGFRKVHIKLVEGLIEACRHAGVTRLLHVSALHAGTGSSHYLKSKGNAEALLKSADDLNVSIFQPSVIFGKGDQFFNRFAGMLNFMPLLPLACPGARLQPVYAADVARAMTASLQDPMTWGKSYQLAGPQVYTLKELLQFTANTMRKRRWIIGLPGFMSAAMAVLLDRVPGKPFSWDNYQSLQTANTSEQNGFAYFGIYPRAIDLVVPDYLVGSVHQRRLHLIRKRSHR